MAVYTEHEDVASSKVLVAGNTYSVVAYDGSGAAFNIGKGGSVIGEGKEENRIVFSGNSATGYGGAVYSLQGAGNTFTNVIFADNSGSQGGAIWGGDRTTVIGSTFSGNAGEGGAIFLDDNCALEISDSLFAGNHSAGLGGALRFKGNYNQSKTTVSGSTFTGNYGSHGGVLFSINSEAVFAGNTCTGNHSQQGGAVYNDANRVITLNHNIFDGNYATGTSQGGAVVNDTNATAHLNYNVFINNYAVTGGAVCNRTGATLNLTGGTFAGNLATGSTNCFGGAIYNAGMLYIDGGTTGVLFSGNSATHGGAIGNWGTATVKGATFTGNIGQGGGIYNESGKTLTVENVVFSGNAGAIFVDANASLTVKGTAQFLTSSDTIVNNSSAAFVQAAVALNAGLSGTGSYTVTDSSFTFGNTANISVADLTLSGTNAFTFAGTGKVTFASGEDLSGSTVKVDTTAFDLSQSSYTLAANFSGVALENISKTGDHSALWRLKLDGTTLSVVNEAADIYASSETDEVVVCGTTFAGVYKGDSVPGTVSKKSAVSGLETGRLVLNAETGLKNVLISGQSGETFGGAIYISQYAGQILVEGSTFADNSANSHGGVVGNWGKSSVTTSTFTGNTFTGNHAVTGGVLHNEAGRTVTLNENIFEGNYANYGGALHNDAGNTMLNINGGRFINNYAVSTDTWGGGGALRNQAVANLTGGTTGLLFSGSTAAMAGAALNNTGTLTVSGATFTGSKATYGTIYNGATANISGSTFTGNTKVSYGGAIFNKGTATFTNVVAADNRDSQGTVFFNEDGATLNISGGRYAGNSYTANIGNGVIFNNAAVTVTDNAVFTGNSGYQGSVLCNTKAAANFTMTGGTIGGNVSSWQGGAIYAAGTVNMTGVVVSGNSTRHDGGFAYLGGAAATFTDVIVSSNTAKEGGAIYNGYLTIHGGTFADNAAWTNDGGGQGGAIYTTGSLTIDNGTLFSGNRTTAGGKTGGAIYISGAFWVNGATFSHNLSASSGGAIAMAGGTLANVRFIGNTAGASSYGGAIINTGTMEGDKLYFEGGAAQRGGAIYNTAAATIKDSGFTAVNTGYGAVYNVGTITFTGSTFTDNKGGGYGGAIHNAGSLTINGGLFTGGSASHGGAIFNNGSFASITGATFTGNYGGNGGAIYNDDGKTMSLSGVVFDNNTSGNGGAISNRSGTMNISGIAKFLTNSDSIITMGAVNFNGATVQLNASMTKSGNGSFTVTDSSFTFGNDTSINVAGMTLEGTNAFTFAGTGRVDFLSLMDFSGTTITVDTSALDLAKDYKLATNFSGVEVKDIIKTGDNADKWNLKLDGNTLSISNNLTPIYASEPTSSVTICGMSFDGVYVGDEVPAELNKVTAVSGIDNLAKIVVSAGTAGLKDSVISGSASHGLEIKSGATALLENTIVKDCSGAYGGGIRNDGALVIRGGSFSGDSTSHGGVIYNGGTTTITGATFTGNTAEYGAALFNDDNKSITLNNVVFDGNTATYNKLVSYSGALFNRYGASITVNGAQFLTISDSIQGQAGSTFSFNGDIVLNTRVYGDSTITVDSATKIVFGEKAFIADATFTNNGALTIDSSAIEQSQQLIANYVENGTLTHVGGSESRRLEMRGKNLWLTVDGAEPSAYCNLDWTEGTCPQSIVVDGSIVSLYWGVNAFNTIAAAKEGVVANGTLGLVGNIGTDSLNFEDYNGYIGNAKISQSGLTFGSSDAASKSFTLEKVTTDEGFKLGTDVNIATEKSVSMRVKSSLINGDLTCFAGGSASIGDYRVTLSGSTFRNIHTFGEALTVNGDFTVTVIGSTAGILAGKEGSGSAPKTAFLSVGLGTTVLGGITGFDTITVDGDAHLVYSGASIDAAITVYGKLTFDGGHLTSGVSYADFNVVVTGSTASINADNGAWIVNNNRAYYFSVVDDRITETTVGKEVTVSIGGVETKAIYGVNAFTSSAAARAVVPGTTQVVVVSESIDSNFYGKGDTVISGGTVALTTYGGQLIKADGSVVDSSLTITGGSFASMVVGGSRVSVTGTDAAVTGGTAALNVSGGTLASHLVAAGYVINSGDEGTASLTMTESNLNLANISTDNYAVGGAFVNNGSATVSTVNVAVTSGTYKSVFGGGWAQKGTSGVTTANITVSGGSIHNLYAGGTDNGDGNAATVGTANITISGGSVRNVILNGKYSRDTVTEATLNVTGACEINWIEGLCHSMIASSASTKTAVNIGANLTVEDILDVDKWNLTKVDTLLDFGTHTANLNGTLSGEQAVGTVIDFQIGEQSIGTEGWTAIAANEFEGLGESSIKINSTLAAYDSTKSAWTSGAYTVTLNNSYDDTRKALIVTKTA